MGYSEHGGKWGSVYVGVGTVEMMCVRAKIPHGRGVFGSTVHVHAPAPGLAHTVGPAHRLPGLHRHTTSHTHTLRVITGSCSMRPVGLAVPALAMSEVTTQTRA